MLVLQAMRLLYIEYGLHDIGDLDIPLRHVEYGTTHSLILRGSYIPRGTTPFHVNSLVHDICISTVRYCHNGVVLLVYTIKNNYLWDCYGADWLRSWPDSAICMVLGTHCESQAGDVMNYTYTVLSIGTLKERIFTKAPSMLPSLQQHLCRSSQVCARVRQ